MPASEQELNNRLKKIERRLDAVEAEGKECPVCESPSKFHVAGPCAAPHHRNQWHDSTKPAPVDTLVSRAHAALEAASVKGTVQLIADFAREYGAERAVVELNEIRHCLATDEFDRREFIAMLESRIASLKAKP